MKKKAADKAMTTARNDPLLDSILPAAAGTGVLLPVGFELVLVPGAEEADEGGGVDSDSDSEVVGTGSSVLDAGSSVLDGTGSSVLDGSGAAVLGGGAVDDAGTGEGAVLLFGGACVVVSTGTGVSC